MSFDKDHKLPSPSQDAMSDEINDKNGLSRLETGNGVGQVVELNKTFTTMSTFSLALSLMATWETLLSTMGLALVSGGTVSLVYGYIRELSLSLFQSGTPLLTCKSLLHRQRLHRNVPLRARLHAPQRRRPVFHD